MLVPGQRFSRQFTTAGSYSYSDGQGNDGVIIVNVERRIYLPVILRDFTGLMP